MSLPALLTVQEACRELSVSRPTLIELRRTGRIAFVRIGARGVRIPAVSIQRFLAESIEADPDVALAAPQRRRVRSGNDDGPDRR
jgi:excisionase family DNA binding protein